MIVGGSIRSSYHPPFNAGVTRFRVLTAVELSAVGPVGETPKTGLEDDFPTGKCMFSNVHTFHYFSGFHEINFCRKHHWINGEMLIMHREHRVKAGMGSCDNNQT